MSSEAPDQGRGRRILLLLAALFIVPLAVAWLAYLVRPGWLPDGGTNRGELLETPVVLERIAPDDPLTLAARGEWSLVLVAPGDCDVPCLQALHMLRQVHIALGKHRDRIQRLLLVGADGALPATLADDYPALVFARADDARRAAILDALPTDGRLRVFLADPLTNVILAYAPAGTDDDIYTDLKHLLKVSRIG